MSSNSEVRVVEIKMEPHPNADSLSIVRIHGWQVVVRTADWKDGDRAAYIVPDSLVDARRSEFSFLAPKEGATEKPVRIGVRKLRGIISHGLLVPAPGAEIDADLAETLGVTRYEPDAGDGGDNTRAPKGYHPTYNVESWRRYGEIFVPGERVIVTEKVNGEQCRIFCDEEGKFHVGSRTAWKAKISKSGDPIYWWKALTPEIKSLCRVTGWTLYGELHGSVRGMKYGLSDGELRFICFDAWNSVTDRWIGYDDLRDALGGYDVPQEPVPVVPYVPVLYDGPYDRETILAFVDGNTLVNGAAHIREGIVIHAVNERNDDAAGRAVLKIVSDDYLEKVK